MRVTAFSSLFVVLAIALVGCATPAPLVRLTPRATDVIWVGGRASVQQEEAGVRVASAFEHQDGRTLGVRVEIDNHTAARLEVGPGDITFTTCVDETIASCAPTLRVIDPEQVLAALDVAQSRGAADAASSQAFLGTMVLLSAVGDVASVAGGHPHPSVGLNTLATANLMESDSATRDREQSTIAVQRQIWSNQALRRNTLDPGQGTGGLVYLPINLRAGYVWLHATVAGSVFHFRFEQIVTQATIPRTGTQRRQF
jgi:hypothetical protein